MKLAKNKKQLKVQNKTVEKLLDEIEYLKEELKINGTKNKIVSHIKFLKLEIEKKTRQAQQLIPYYFN